MSSGEADYRIDVSNVTTPPLQSNIPLRGNSQTNASWDGSYYYDWYPRTTYTSYVSWTTTVYMYQLICPRCGKTNWGQIDTVVECSGELKTFGSKKRVKCGAKIKAVKEKVDYEVPVG